MPRRCSGARAAARWSSLTSLRGRSLLCEQSHQAAPNLARLRLQLSIGAASRRRRVTSSLIDSPFEALSRLAGVRGAARRIEFAPEASAPVAGAATTPSEESARTHHPKDFALLNVSLVRFVRRDTIVASESIAWRQQQSVKQAALARKNSHSGARRLDSPAGRAHRDAAPVGALLDRLFVVTDSMASMRAAAAGAWVWRASSSLTSCRLRQACRAATGDGAIVCRHARYTSPAACFAFPVDDADAKICV